MAAFTARHMAASTLARTFRGDKQEGVRTRRLAGLLEVAPQTGLIPRWRKQKVPRLLVALKPLKPRQIRGGSTRCPLLWART